MKKLLAAMLLTAGLGFGQVSLGIRIGPPPAPRVVRVRPVAPGPGYFWVDGYWYPDGGRYHWHEGYWTRPPYAGAHWVGPRHEGGMFYAGFGTDRADASNTITSGIAIMTAATSAKTAIKT